jgi:N-acyl-D-aspartate/D-glutamate deacylase
VISGGLSTMRGRERQDWSWKRHLASRLVIGGTSRNRANCQCARNHRGRRWSRERQTDFVQARLTDTTAAEEARAATEELIKSRVCMAGSSDGGAHILCFWGVDFPTRLLTEWVPDVLSFEEAVSRLTSVPAAVHGLTDRGVIRVGAAADLLLIDWQQLGAGDTRFVSEFPAGTGRLVIDANGYRTSIVNGEILLQDGMHTGVLPGQILRR